MRAIGTIEQEKQAILFGDYLYSLGIESDIEADQQGGGFLVWILEDIHLQQALVEFEAFQTDPTHPRYAQGAKDGRRLWDIARKEQEKAAPVIDARTVTGTGGNLAPPIVSFALIALSVAVFFPSMSGTGGIPPYWENLFISRIEGAGILPEVRAGEIWRLWTPILLHFGLIHILFNMMWMMQLGTMLERIHGNLFFAVMVLSIALVSNVAQYFGGGPNFGGMSGVVFGIFGFAWIRGRMDPSVPYQLDRQTIIFVIIFMFLCYTGLIGRIANWAHTVGLVMGMGMGYLTARSSKLTK